jgi:hypothetical protein
LAVQTGQTQRPAHLAAERPRRLYAHAKTPSAPRPSASGSCSRCLQPCRCTTPRSWLAASAWRRSSNRP